jgi:hypothetical protein
MLDDMNAEDARLLPEFEKLSSTELLDHFRERGRPTFWPSASVLSDTEKERIISEADRIVQDSSWELMGFGVLRFDGGTCWRRDPLSGYDWGLEYHADVVLARGDGTDVRVLWELNRFGHAITLARAYSATGDEKYAETYFSHVESWIDQNPYARGANWSCAMEVALRAANLLAALDIFRASASLTEERLSLMLRLFDQHGRFILDNNEFSYIATSNHYLSDVVGLFWIGTMMPELADAAKWREFGQKEMLAEMDKQVLPDGADFEASTGYHRFVTEMFNASFQLAKRNGIEIDERYWKTLDKMHEYLAAITRPDGGIPLVGDCDGSSFLSETPVAVPMHRDSEAFTDAGIYVLRDKDLYLHFNASDCGVNGRGSHGHNDALSIEVSVFGRSFIVDPGSYAYNLDLEARHLFRSTAYHSTVMIDGVEQNTTLPELPFVIGNEASPKVLEWTTTENRDRVTAEHFGYKRLQSPVIHRRSIEFDKVERLWIVDDEFTGQGTHEFTFSFHLAQGLSVDDDGDSIILTAEADRKIILLPVGIDVEAVLYNAFFSPDYGRRVPSQIISWTVTAAAPCAARFLIVPSGPDDNIQTGLELAKRIADNS